MKSGVIWITGLSGVGKSVTSKEVIKKIRNEYHLANSLIVDGDQIREIVQDEKTGHDRASRIINAYRISRFAKMLEEQNMIVIVATMSLYQEIHEWNRKNFKNYFEVYLTASLEVLHKRDQKKLYSQFKKGEQKDIVGLDLKAEIPLEPNLILQNEGDINSISKLADEIINKVTWLNK